MFNLRPCNAATIRYSQLKFGHMHLCGMDYKCFAPHCCKWNSFGCTAAIRCDNACHGPHSDSLYSRSEDSQFNSPGLVKREAGFPNPRRALIGSSQLWLTILPRILKRIITSYIVYHMKYTHSFLILLIFVVVVLTSSVLGGFIFISFTHILPGCFTCTMSNHVVAQVLVK